MQIAVFVISASDLIDIVLCFAVPKPQSRNQGSSNFLCPVSYATLR